MSEQSLAIAEKASFDALERLSVKAREFSARWTPRGGKTISAAYARALRGLCEVQVDYFLKNNDMLVEEIVLLKQRIMELEKANGIIHP